MPRKILIANWKENPKREREAYQLFKDVAKVKRAGATRNRINLVICPPFIYLEEIAAHFRKFSATAKKNLAIGAQDIFWEDKGAFTSEVGPRMIKSLGASYVIIGHSERRKYLKETDAMINKKIKLAIADKLNIVLCVGESLVVRKRGEAAAKKFVENQLKQDLRGISFSSSSTSTARLKPNQLTIAYEPIWAIGTGKSDQPEDAVAMAKVIKNFLKKHCKINPRLLYGGSTNAKNIADYVKYKEIDGALVGGASLKAKEFAKMIEITANS